MVAPTGSGKTLAYALPLLDALRALEPRLERADGTAALVLAPTRELCAQIADVLSRRGAFPRRALPGERPS